MGITVKKQTKTIRWFFVSALYKTILVDKPRRRDHWEHRVFVFQATHQKQAERKAAILCKKQEMKYLGGLGDTVQVTFEAIECIHELLDSEIEDGTEVYWRPFTRQNKSLSPQKKIIPNPAIK
jgi:Domain of unknown function (DUF4288)